MGSSRDLLERLFVTSNVGHGLNQEETGIYSIFPRFVEIFAAVVLLVGGTFELSGDSEKHRRLGSIAEDVPGPKLGSMVRINW